MIDRLDRQRLWHVLVHRASGKRSRGETTSWSDPACCSPSLRAVQACQYSQSRPSKTAAGRRKSRKLASLRVRRQGGVNSPIFSILAVVPADTSFRGVPGPRVFAAPATRSRRLVHRGGTMSLRYGYLALLGIGLACQLGLLRLELGPGGLSLPADLVRLAMRMSRVERVVQLPAEVLRSVQLLRRLHGLEQSLRAQWPERGSLRTHLRRWRVSRDRSRRVLSRPRVDAADARHPAARARSRCRWASRPRRRRSNPDARGVSYDQPIDSRRSSRKLGRPPYRYAR